MGKDEDIRDVMKAYERRERTPPKLPELWLTAELQIRDASILNSNI